MKLSDIQSMDYSALDELDVSVLYEFEELEDVDADHRPPAHLAPRECLLVECLIDNMAEALGLCHADELVYWFEVLRRVLAEFEVTDRPPTQDERARGRAVLQGGHGAGGRA